MLRRWLLTKGICLSYYLGYHVGNAVKLLRESEHWAASKIEDHQVSALRRLMHHCYNQVPYYSDLMKSRNLLPEDFTSVSDLAKLPYLTRDIVRAEGIRLRAVNYPDNLCQFRRSGGTTGEPIKVAVNDQARALELASWLRGLGWMKHRLGRPMVFLFGGSLGLKSRWNLKSTIRDWMLNIRFMPAFELTPENVGDYYKAIRQAKGGTLVGYTSAVINLVEYMSRRGLQGSSLETVLCTSEQMPEEWRKRISEVLGAPVFCYYGCGELNGIASECFGVEGYLVSQEHVILEAANGDPTQFRNNGRGNACITSLFNYAMPLIRYLNGDMLTLARNDSGQLVIAQIEGRTGDQLTALDGHSVSSALPPHLVFKSGVPVWKYQVVQTEADKIVFHYMVRDGSLLTSDMQKVLIDVFRRHLGEKLQVFFVSGDFESTRSGKHRFVINKIPAPRSSPT
jgi:phenylacetate-CoA ligase